MEGVALPEVVGVGFGKGESNLGGAVAGWLEQVVAAVVVPPGLDGPPREADVCPVFVGEGHGADRLVAGMIGVSGGVF